MIKGKKILLLSLTSGASIAMAIAGATFASRKNVRMNVHGDLHDASCVWNHYDAVMPTTSEHGSQEFWACCTHAGNFVFEEPEVNNPSQITDCGQLSGAYFADLGNDDARYIPQLEAATASDAIVPVTVSDLGFTSGDYIKTGAQGHNFLRYDFLENGGADVWLKYRFSSINTNGNVRIYLLNNIDENGLVIRLDSRTENDGIAVMYIYSSGQSGNTGTDSDIPAGESESSKYFFPRPSGFRKDTDFVLHFAISLTDETNNIFNVKIEGGAVGGDLYQVSTGPEMSGYVPRSFNIEMGAGFTSWANKNIRFTSTSENDTTLSDIESLESVVVYKDASGNVLGKMSNPGTAKMPNVKVANKTFVGWFDAKGNRLVNGTAVTTKYVVTSRYVDNKANMFVPSDTTEGRYAAAKGGWFDVESTSASGASSGQIPVSDISGGYDFYFIYHIVSRTAEDNYANFDIPYDYSDGKTRIELRIDNPSSGILKGFISGSATNLGGAGAEGTQFVVSGFRANGSDLLVHVSVSNASAAGLTYVVEIVNLGNGQTHTETRNVTFNDSTLYSLNALNRNRFDCRKTNCEYRITDAF
ncbi:MAG: hypothetical protein IKP50_03160 [Bacilli bacterium]|nr:hypothetical protein [Bacilli bacterium]